MTKADLVAAVAAEVQLTKKDADKAVSALIETVTDALKNGDKIQLVGFGTFEVRERPERTGRNPRTKETITIPATKVPAFKAGQGFKAAISK